LDRPDSDRELVSSFLAELIDVISADEYQKAFTILLSRGSASQGSLEKVTEKDVEMGNSSRPSNPTPSLGGPRVDPAMNAPDALSQVTPTTTVVDGPSSAHSTNTTMSYGVQVASRWRSSLLQPQSRIGSDSSPGDPSSPPSHLFHNQHPTTDEARAL